MGRDPRAAFRRAEPGGGAPLSAADVAYLDDKQAAVLWEQMQKGRAKRKEEVIKAAKARTAALAIDRDFFGIRLGEGTGEMETRCTGAGLVIDKTTHRFADPDHPGAIWTFAGAANGSEAVAETRVHVYRNRVYTVDLYMKDASLPNFEALKGSLAKKYEKAASPPGTPGALRADFQAEISGHKVRVALEQLRDGKTDVVRVRYVHDHIRNAVDRMTRMVKRKKVSTIEDDL